MLVVTISGPHMVWRERFRAVRLYRGMRPGLEAGRGGTRSFRKARIEGNGERPVCPRVPPPSSPGIGPEVVDFHGSGSRKEAERSSISRH